MVWYGLSLFFILVATAAEIEVAAYALQTFTTHGDLTTASLIVKWLSQQRNALGGFTSTQVHILLMYYFTNNLWQEKYVVCSYYIYYTLEFGVCRTYGLKLSHLYEIVFMEEVHLHVIIVDNGNYFQALQMN